MIVFFNDVLVTIEVYDVKALVLRMTRVCQSSEARLCLFTNTGFIAYYIQNLVSHRILVRILFPRCVCHRNHRKMGNDIAWSESIFLQR